MISPVYASNDKPAKGKGRKDKGQERALEPQVLKDRAKELIRLATVADMARSALSTAVKQCAEASGFNASAIRGMINARHKGDDAVKLAHRNAQQLAIAIDETSELSEGGQQRLAQ